MPPGYVCMATRWPFAGLTSSQTLKRLACSRLHMVMWPKTILPSAVAGPVAAKAEQRSFFGTGGFVVLRVLEALAFQSGRRGVQGAVEERDLDVAVEGDHVDQVDGPAVELGAGRGGAVGDALHLFEELRVVPPQEQGVDEHAERAVGLGRGLRTVLLAERADVVDDLGGQQLAVLVAAFVRLALDVQDDPTRLGIAVRRPEAFDGRRVRRERFRRQFARAVKTSSANDGETASATAASEINRIDIQGVSARLGRFYRKRFSRREAFSSRPLMHYHWSQGW